MLVTLAPIDGRKECARGTTGHMVKLPQGGVPGSVKPRQRRLHPQYLYRR
jgi:hypothetical protein